MMANTPILIACGLDFGAFAGIHPDAETAKPMTTHALTARQQAVTTAISKI